MPVGVGQLGVDDATVELVRLARRDFITASNPGPNVVLAGICRLSRRRTLTVCPGATESNEYQIAAFVPSSNGLMACVSPCTIRWLTASFGYWLVFRSAPNSETALVSLSQNSITGAPSAAR